MDTPRQPSGPHEFSPRGGWRRLRAGEDPLVDGFLLDQAAALRERREAAHRWRRRGNRYDYDPPLPDDLEGLTSGASFELKPAPARPMSWRTRLAIAAFAAANAVVIIPDLPAAANRLLTALLS